MGTVTINERTFEQDNEQEKPLSYSEFYSFKQFRKMNDMILSQQQTIENF